MRVKYQGKLVGEVNTSAELVRATDPFKEIWIEFETVGRPRFTDGKEKDGVFTDVEEQVLLTEDTLPFFLNELRRLGYEVTE